MTELVPLVYGRNAYNTIHGTELQGHNDALTTEQAGCINQNFDIELHFGSHGKFDDQSENEVLDGEYEAVTGVVESMKPGDVLFIEGYGITHAVREPIAQDLDETLPRDSPYRKFVEMLMTDSGIDLIDMVRGRRQTHQDWLDTMRQQQKISAWGYASEMARRKGIRVVGADLDAFDTQNAKELGFQNHKKNIELYQGKGGQWLDGRVHAWRERTARNVVKDWALDHMPSHPPLSPDDKPKLVILFGVLHYTSLKQAFNEVGLETTEQTMDMTERVQAIAREMSTLRVKTTLELGRTATKGGGFRIPREVRQRSNIPRGSGLRRFGPSGRISSEKKEQLGSQTDSVHLELTDE